MHLMIEWEYMIALKQCISGYEHITLTIASAESSTLYKDIIISIYMDINHIHRN